MRFLVRDFGFRVWVQCQESGGGVEGSGFRPWGFWGVACVFATPESSPHSLNP